MSLALTRTGWSATSGNGSGWITPRQSNALNGKPSSRKGSGRPRLHRSASLQTKSRQAMARPQSSASLTPRIAALRRPSSPFTATSKASPANRDAYKYTPPGYLRLPFRTLAFLLQITSPRTRIVLYDSSYLSHIPLQLQHLPHSILPSPRGVCLLPA